MRRIVSLVLALATALVSGVPAMATGFTVTAPTTINYDASLDGFAVSGITFSGAPAYIQVGLTLQTESGVQVDQNDNFRIATLTQCTFDATWQNSATNGQVVVSGDNSTNVILAGNAADVLAAIGQLWIFRTDSSFCGAGSAQNIGQELLSRKLKVTAVESAPGLFWSPSTHHYYQLATQTTSDGIGQPTNDSGTITDASRYFVRWSTARANAKAASVTIGGHTHNGYLAAITTKDEFAFLNDNVTGGSGVLYPAWVGGSDAANEGTWKWVDGPEALKFGGDTLTHFVDRQVAPDGKILQQDSEGSFYLDFPMDGYSYPSFVTSVTFMRDSAGNKVLDENTNYPLALNPDNASYCSAARNDNFAAWDDFVNNGPAIEATPYGSYVRCDMENYGWPYLVPKIQDVDGNIYPTSQAIFITEWGYPLAGSDGNFRAAEPGTGDFTQQSGEVANFEGATFWGPDYGAPDGAPSYCNNRGVRGVCTQSQQQSNGQWADNSYYVRWSNGNRTNTGNWDGTGSKPGDGVYSPQPDNYNGNNTEGEDGLIINWCARNGGVGNNSDATPQTLYGNSGYFCTPGWNDLTSGDWSLGSATYPNGNDYDTPNHIGTTDYVIEYCGYDGEASCEADPSTSALSSFAISTASGCGEAGASTRLDVSYAAAGVDTTDLTSDTMVTETFDSFPQGWWNGGQTAVGVISGQTYIGPAGEIGGSGGTGNFPTGVDTVLTLPTTECYIGFWWSAGNANNNVQLLDASDNVLATFTAGDLVANLGACPNAYCGNPNLNYAVAGELFAFVHLRLPSGFDKVRFFGQGFEFDTVSLSIDVPTRSANETAVTTDTVNLTCATTDAAAASSSLVACPQAVTITANTATEYNPLANSQISGYAYPGDVSVVDTYVYSGVGTATLSAAPVITLTSNTVGQYFVDYKISQGGVNRTSRITVTVVAGGSVTIVAPEVVLVDPRNAVAEFPSFELDGAANAAVCLAQVADAQGTALSGSPTLTFAQKSGASVTAAWVGSSFALAGTLSSVQSATASLTASRAQALTLGGEGSFFVQIRASASATANSDSCASGATAIVEIRPINLDIESSLTALLSAGN